MLACSECSSRRIDRLYPSGPDVRVFRAGQSSLRGFVQLCECVELDVLAVAAGRQKETPRAEEDSVVDRNNGALLRTKQKPPSERLPCIAYAKLCDERPSDHVAVQFLTNAFFVPYMAVRERLPSREERKLEKPRQLPSFSRVFGIVSFAIAGISVAWLLGGRPESGGLDVRWAFAVEQFNCNRAFWAFVLDLGLYTVWQAVLMTDCGAPVKYRYVPFFGLAAWLVADGGSVSTGLKSGFWDTFDKSN